MDIDITEIKERLIGQLDGSGQGLFWEDEGAEYKEALPQLCLEGVRVLDATGRELAAKREALRGGEGKVLVYRSGGAPRPEDDFLYDLKLSLTPFSCKMEGIWASECGISPQFAGVLADHAKFFNAKDRKALLRESGLDKSASDSLRLAMLAACAGARPASARDAVRDVAGRLVLEHAKGQSKTYSSISESGLLPALWSFIRDVFGYSAPEGGEPSVDDLALRMLQTRCAAVLPESPDTLSADAVRVLEDLGSSSRTREGYDALAASYRAAIAGAVPKEERTMRSLKAQDTIIDFDQWILEDMLGRALAGTLSAAEAADMANARKHTLWFGGFKDHYACLVAATKLAEALDAFNATVVSKTDAKAIFGAYCGEWHAIDLEYRHFNAAYHAIASGRFKASLDDLRGRLIDGYNKYLTDLTDRWQIHLLDEGTYPPASIPAQSGFFYERIQKSFPKAEDGRRIGVIISDALRFEVGAELAARANAGGLRGFRKNVIAACEGMACMLPSYTQLGMAALLPAGPMEIDPKTENVAKGGKPTAGLENRRKLTDESLPGSVLLQASTVLESGLPPVDKAPLVVVYHNVIDKRGDNRDTEGQVFQACEEAIEQILRMSAELLKAGCSKVLVTADHGFLYQDQPVEDFNYAVVEGLSDLASSDADLLNHTRRFAVGSVLPKSDALIEYATVDLSLEGDYKVALSKGITRLRQRGSGSRYVHGGASLQENVVPVVTIEAKRGAKGSAPTGVQGFLHGRPVITGSSVMLEVYQTQPCSEKVAPLSVKVGLYDPDEPKRLLCAAEQVLELASASRNSEDRKIKVTLNVTNDVDDCPTAMLRISSRVGKTNQYKTEWEQALTVSRAFGNDFDF